MEEEEEEDVRKINVSQEGIKSVAWEEREKTMQIRETGRKRDCSLEGKRK